MQRATVGYGSRYLEFNWWALVRQVEGRTIARQLRVNRAAPLEPNRTSEPAGKGKANTFEVQFGLQSGPPGCRIADLGRPGHACWPIETAVAGLDTWTGWLLFLAQLGGTNEER